MCNLIFKLTLLIVSLNIFLIIVFCTDIGFIPQTSDLAIYEFAKAAQTAIAVLWTSTFFSKILAPFLNRQVATDFDMYKSALKSNYSEYRDNLDFNRHVIRIQISGLSE